MNTEKYTIRKMSFGFGQSKWHVVGPKPVGLMPLTAEFNTFTEALNELKEISK